jgi:hypothetical protein
MIVCSRTKKIYYPTSGKQSQLIYGSTRVRYVRTALVVRPKN